MSDHLQDARQAAIEEGQKALHWRVNIMGLSRSQLEREIGWSVSVIQNIEMGFKRESGELLHERTRRRYRDSCAALMLRKQGYVFDWEAIRASQA